MITAVNNADHPRIRQALPNPRQPINNRDNARNPDKARNVPSQGPRLKVKIIPRNWIVRMIVHVANANRLTSDNLKVPVNRLVELSCCMETLASSKEIDIGINMAAPANTALPSVAVTLAPPTFADSEIPKKGLP